ncbi:immunoglobulin-like domain-containing protein, partial [Carnobacterium maltaromaticum]|uniref:immunoglobulin-like domain-containing protein n=1 Tax=Carnobacterium maltaromaticum TaxID=2751 RepID=UPI00026C8A8F
QTGDTVTITAYDKNDKVLDANKPVKIKAVVQGTISPSVYNVGETTIKGSYTGDIVKARVLINGEPQAWGGTFSGGSFSYYIGAGKIKANDNVKIIGYSADNSELSTQVVTVQP